MLRAVSEQLYADFPPEPEEATSQNLVKNLLYPFALFQVLDKDLQSLYETTVSSIENVLGVKRKEIDLEKLWKEYRGTLTTESLESYFGPVSFRQEQSVKIAHCVRFSTIMWSGDPTTSAPNFGRIIWPNLDEILT
jgi:hypothetical protein